MEAVTLNEQALGWLETRVKLQLSARTYEHYANALKKHILPRFGHLNLSQIQMGHAHKLIQHLQESGHSTRGVNLILSIFKRVLNEAVKENRLDKNPFQYLKEIKEPPKADVFMRFEDIDKIHEVSKGHYFHSLFLTAINTGMRRGEIAGL
jgi:site-specific recombinase XerD